MKTARTVELAKRGLITLPKEIRDQHDFQEGHLFTMIDLDGVIILSPKLSKIDGVAESARYGLEESGLGLEDILKRLKKLRRDGKDD